MNDAEQSTATHCPECGALVSEGVQKCWLCGWQRDSDSSPRPAEAVAPRVVPSPAGQGFSFSLETLMLVMTLAAVGMGAIVLFPGIGIILAIMLAPAFVRTAMVVQRRAEKGKAVALWQRVALFFGSFVTAVVILVIVAVASVGTFCALCLCLYSGGVRDAAMPLSFFAAAATTIAAIVLAVKWIRRRWRHDTQIK